MGSLLLAFSKGGSSSVSLYWVLGVLKSWTRQCFEFAPNILEKSLKITDLYCHTSSVFTSPFYWAPGQESTRRISDVKVVFWSTLSFLKIKTASFFKLHNFSIWKLESHGSSLYLSSQDSGGRHRSLTFCRRIFRRAWRTWLISFLRTKFPYILPRRVNNLKNNRRKIFQDLRTWIIFDTWILCDIGPPQKNRTPT